MIGQAWHSNAERLWRYRLERICIDEAMRHDGILLRRRATNVFEVVWGSTIYATRGCRRYEVAVDAALAYILNRMVAHSPEACKRLGCGKPRRTGYWLCDFHLREHWRSTKARYRKQADITPRAKVNEAQVREIRWLWERKVNWRVIARQFNISPSSVHRIAKRYSWKHVV